MKTEDVKKTMDDIKQLQMEVGSWERAKEVAKAEVESLQRRRKDIFAEHETHKQAAMSEAIQRIDESKKLQGRIDQSRNELAEAQARHQAAVQDFATERANFNSERNALQEQVKQSQEKLARIQSFLKAIDLARVGL